MKDCGCSADIKFLELAVKSAQNGGVVPADVDHLEPLQVQIAIEGLGEHLIWGYQGVEGPGPEGDGGEKQVVLILGQG